MAISFLITDTPQLVPLQHSRSPVTLSNASTSANTFYYRLSQAGTDAITFEGNAATLAGLAHGSLSPGLSFSLPPSLGTIDVACATGETATLNIAMGIGIPRLPTEKSWAFASRDAATGTNYIGGFYNFASSDNDFNPATSHGTINVSYAAHFFLVQAAGASGGTDTVIRVSGTTIDDGGTRTTGVDVDIAVADDGAAGTYYETTEKWIGEVTITKQSGPDLLCNFGFCKYWDNHNTNFKIIGLDVTWLAGQNDGSPDILLRHHKATGWTYNNLAEPTPPAEVASMNTDHNTEIQIAMNQEGAWKRDNLSTNVEGGDSEGTIIEIVSTANKSFAIGNFLLRITPQ